MTEINIQELRERANNAKEIARPIADGVDWYIDEAGEINAIHQSEPITTEERLATIAYVVADDAIHLADVNTALLDEVERLREQYYNIADAIAPESESAEQLAQIARDTRYERNRLLEENETLKVQTSKNSFIELQLRCELSERITDLQIEIDDLKRSRDHWKQVAEHEYKIGKDE